MITARLARSDSVICTRSRAYESTIMYTMMCMGGFGQGGICTHTHGSDYKVYEYRLALDADGHKKSRNNAGFK